MIEWLLKEYDKKSDILSDCQYFPSQCNTSTFMLWLTHWEKMLAFKGPAFIGKKNYNKWSISFIETKKGWDRNWRWSRYQYRSQIRSRNHSRNRSRNWYWNRSLSWTWNLWWNWSRNRCQTIDSLTTIVKVRFKGSVCQTKLGRENSWSRDRCGRTAKPRTVWQLKPEGVNLWRCVLAPEGSQELRFRLAQYGLR